MTPVEALRAAHRSRLAELLPPLSERLDWPREDLERERERALRDLVAAARTGSRWHRDRLAGLDASEVTLNGLRSLPTMTKSDLMADYDDVVTDPRITLEACESHLAARPAEYLLGQFRVVASGGSSGVRGVFVYGWDAWATCYASVLRWQHRDWSGDSALDGVARVTAVVGASHPTHMSAALGQTFSSGEEPRHLFPVSQPLPTIVTGLNALQPTVLMAYASYLPQLVREVSAGRLRIHPRRVIAISEPLLPEVRAGAEAAWGVPVASGYGMSEGLFAGSCGQALHLPDDLCIVEPLDADGNAAGPGQPAARMLLTNLYGTTLPLIRYDVTDQLVISPGTCACGSAMSTTEDPQGRADDVFTYLGALAVHPHTFRTVLGSHPELLEYRVVQTPRGAHVEVVSAERVDTETIGARLRDGLATLGLPAPVIVVDQVPHLPRHPSGKLQRFTSLPQGGSRAQPPAPS